jgi:ketosteroid isomerase-like protein
VISGKIAPVTTNAERVGRIYALIDGMKTDELIDEFADDVVMELPFAPGAMPKRYEGKAAAAGFLTSVRDAFSSFSMMVDAVHETTDPHVVIVEHHADGVVAENGRTYDNRYVTFITFDAAGEVTHWREYYDAGVVVRAFRP